jgi:type II secretory pathway component PulF
MSSITPTTDVSKRLPTTILVVAIHSLLWITWLLGLLMWAPRAERIFRNFNMRVPGITELVLSLSRFVSIYLLFAGIGLCLFLGADGLIYYRLRSSARRFRSELWSLVMILLPALVIVGTAIGLLNPLIWMLEALSR